MRPLDRCGRRIPRLPPLGRCVSGRMAGARPPMCRERRKSRWCARSRHGGFRFRRCLPGSQRSTRCSPIIRALPNSALIYRTKSTAWSTRSTGSTTSSGWASLPRRRAGRSHANSPPSAPRPRWRASISRSGAPASSLPWAASRRCWWAG